MANSLEQIIGSLQRHVGSIHNLVAFEAAARHQSFSRAATELSVTQPAVSQAVKRLEDALGAKLFLRGHRKITLTDSGERLFEDVTDSFARITVSARQIRRMARTDYATLLTSTAFAAWWMVPRLAAFHAANPSIDLRLETVDRDVDIAAEVTTIAIRRGNGSWPGYESALIAPERLRAIASPALLSTLGPFNSLESLLSTPLIHLDEPHRPRPTWRDFFDHFGINGSVSGDGLRLNDYALVLQAAMAGEGLALGWEHLCDRPFAQRLIQPVGEWTWDTGLNFYVIWSKTVSLSDNAKRTRDWIIAEASTAVPNSPRPQPASDFVGKAID